MDDVDPRPDLDPGEEVPAKPVDLPRDPDPAFKLSENGGAAEEPTSRIRPGRASPCAECAKQAEQLEQLRAGLIAVGAAVLLLGLAVILSRAGAAAKATPVDAVAS